MSRDHSVPAKLLTGADTLDHAGYRQQDRQPLVGGLVYIERRDLVAQLGDQRDAGRAGWQLT